MCQGSCVSLHNDIRPDVARSHERLSQRPALAQLKAMKEIEEDDQSDRDGRARALNYFAREAHFGKRIGRAEKHYAIIRGDITVIGEIVVGTAELILIS